MSDTTPRFEAVTIVDKDGNPVNMCNAGAVDSVFGRTGTVTAQNNDYTWNQVDKTVSSIADITTREYNAAGNPTANNDSVDTAGIGRAFLVGDLWINTTNDTSFICADNTATAAIWRSIKTALSMTSTDNSMIRSAGTNGHVQDTGSNATLDDSGNMTLESLIVNSAYGNDAIVDNGNSGATKTISWNSGNYQKVTMTADCVFTYNLPVGKVGIFVMIFIQDGTGNRAATMPASVKAGGGFGINTANSDAGEVDVATYFCDGTNFYQISLDYDMK